MRILGWDDSSGKAVLSVIGLLTPREVQTIISDQQYAETCIQQAGENAKSNFGKLIYKAVHRKSKKLAAAAVALAVHCKPKFVCDTCGMVCDNSGYAIARIRCAYCNGTVYLRYYVRKEKENEKS